MKKKKIVEFDIKKKKKVNEYIKFIVVLLLKVMGEISF